MFSTLSIRLFSLSIPLVLVIVGSTVFAGSREYWTFMLVVAVALGYVHFAVATFYQIRSYVRHEKRALLLLGSAILGVLAFAVCVTLMKLGYTMALGITSIAYFVVHVLLNERTFLSREIGRTLSLPLFVSFSLIVLPLFVSALVHPSFFYDFGLSFPPIDPLEYRAIIHTYLPYDILIGVSLSLLVFFALATPMTLIVRYRQRMLGAVTLLLALAVGLTVIYLPPVNFVFVLHTVLVYHFILLSLLFLPAAQKNNELPLYLFLHACIAIPLGILGWSLFDDASDTLTHIAESIFHFQVFITLSISHITMSFMNEDFVRRLLRINT